MTEIILTNDQTQLFASAIDGVVFCDATGNVVVRIPPKFAEEELVVVSEAKRRLASDQPRALFSEVIKRVEAMGDE